MAKIKNPVRFSTHFNIDETKLTELGALNPTLNVDTKLFIDPFLLPDSRHSEIAVAARRTYENHFGTVIKLLAGSTTKNDAPWRNARRMLTFPEVKYTCLGYGAGSVSGSGQGKFTTDNVIQTAKEIVNLGIDDPDLFVAMGLFEEGIGPDMISDMTTNVIMPDLLAFNARIVGELQISTSPVNIELKNGGTYTANLPINPFIKGGASPVILVPADVLRELPVASDWSDVGDVAAKNSALRKRVNEQIAAIWKRKSKKDKDVVRAWALESEAHFRTCLELLRTAKGKPYDFVADPLGELIWRKVLDTIATTQTLHSRPSDRRRCCRRRQCRLPDHRAVPLFD